MTVVECFEQEPIVNIATCLSLRPNKLIFIGEAEALRLHIERYRSFFEKRSLPTEVIPREVQQNTLQSVVEALEEIIKEGDEVVIDLAGGDSVAIAAAGAIYERYKDEYPISLQRVEPLTGSIQDCDGDGEVEWDRAPLISVKELIELYGGKIAPSDQIEDQASLADIRPIWELSIRNMEHWNQMVAIFNRFEKHSGAKSYHLRIHLHFPSLQQNLPHYSQEKPLFDQLLHQLLAEGIIQMEHQDHHSLTYVYRSPFARRCLHSPGNTLEYKTLMEARELRYYGRPLFTDSRRGVSIDWDGIIHPVVPGGPKDTKNEIDVVLMRGMTPIFISCKNGTIKDSELYKLHTVADRFGGKYAKKILIASDYAPESHDSKLSFQQRAADMGIYFEPHAAHLTDEDWQELFLKIIRAP